MQSLEPKCVDTKDIYNWFKQSFELINRRFLIFSSTVLIFYLILFFASEAINSLANLNLPVVMVSLLIISSAFIFLFILANLILVSHCANHSQSFNLHAMMDVFVPNQKVFFKMAVLAVAAGFFFWSITILFHPEKNLITSSEEIMQMLSSSGSLLKFVLTTSSVYLYFLLIMFFIFRTFFSVPLILFHQLSYQEAQSLSHRAFVKNIKVMMHLLGLWAIIFLATIKLTPVLAVLLLPLFSTFIYVSFRQIFWGQGTNETAKELVTNTVATRAL